jgi:hypothetical protein
MRFQLHFTFRGKLSIAATGFFGITPAMISATTASFGITSSYQGMRFQLHFTFRGKSSIAATGFFGITPAMISTTTASFGITSSYQGMRFQLHFTFVENYLSPQPDSSELRSHNRDSRDYVHARLWHFQADSPPAALWTYALVLVSKSQFQNKFNFL